MLEHNTKYNRIVYDKGELLFEGEKPTHLVDDRNKSRSDEVGRTGAKDENPLDLALKKALEAISLKGPLKAVEESTERAEFESYRGVLKETDYYFYFPNPRKADSFSDYTSEMRSSLQYLESSGFGTRKITHLTDQFIIQEGRGTAKEVIDLSAGEHKSLLRSLEQLIENLVEQRIYVKGLRPSMLLLEENGSLTFKGLDGIREEESAYEAARRFEQELLPHWEKFFDEPTLGLLKQFLKDLKSQLKQEEAA